MDDERKEFAHHYRWDDRIGSLLDHQGHERRQAQHRDAQERASLASDHDLSDSIGRIGAMEDAGFRYMEATEARNAMSAAANRASDAREEAFCLAKRDERQTTADERQAIYEELRAEVAEDPRAEKARAVIAGADPLEAVDAGYEYAADPDYRHDDHETAEEDREPTEADREAAGRTMATASTGTDDGLRERMEAMRTLRQGEPAERPQEVEEAEEAQARPLDRDALRRGNEWDQAMADALDLADSLEFVQERDHHHEAARSFAEQSVRARSEGRMEEAAEFGKRARQHHGAYEKARDAADASPRKADAEETLRQSTARRAEVEARDRKQDAAPEREKEAAIEDGPRNLRRQGPGIPNEQAEGRTWSPTPRVHGVKLTGAEIEKRQQVAQQRGGDDAQALAQSQEDHQKRKGVSR